MTHISEIELKRVIDGLDFSVIIEKMTREQSWALAHANEACRLYKNFLFLRAKYPGKLLPPSEEVDDFWHNHILETKKYREDCNAIFGQYLDHSPDLDLPDASAFEETQNLHLAEFGEYIYQIRSKVLWSFVSFLHSVKIACRGRSILRKR
jgi:hypothetical protein